MPLAEEFGPAAVAPLIDEGIRQGQALRRVTMRRLWDVGETDDFVAVESPVALAYNGVSHAVMMCTPLLLEELAIGFTLAEGIVPALSDIRDVEISPAPDGAHTVDISITNEHFWRLKELRRAMAGRTGCGICGCESLTAAVRPPRPVPRRQSFDLRHLSVGLKALSRSETLGALTGCTHAAAWLHPDGEVAGGVEDIGRHVALDKLLGRRALAGWRDGALFVSSRASYEMVQKAAACGVEILFAVSAPTSLAIRFARESGLTLAAFCRQDNANVYTHPERLLGL